MKIAVFGDSYGDVNNDPDLKGWPHQLATMMGDNNLGKYAQSGTSTWWSYQLFLKNYKKYDVIVFCYSASSRWPILPDELVGQHWRLPGYPLAQWQDKMSKLNEVYFDIFNDDLLSFLSASVFASVNEICRNENKYLINLLSFNRDFIIPETPFPIFEDVSKISRNEEVIRNVKMTTMKEVTCDPKNAIWLEPDKRICHLNNENNHRLASIFKHSIDNTSTSIYSNLFKEYEWTR